MPSDNEEIRSFSCEDAVAAIEVDFIKLIFFFLSWLSFSFLCFLQIPRNYNGRIYTLAVYILHIISSRLPSS